MSAHPTGENRHLFLKQREDGQNKLVYPWGGGSNGISHAASRKLEKLLIGKGLSLCYSDKPSSSSLRTFALAVLSA
jgi:hypothetical protein